MPRSRGGFAVTYNTITAALAALGQAVTGG